MSHSREILKRRQKQQSLDMFLVKVAWKDSSEPTGDSDSITAKQKSFSSSNLLSSSSLYRYSYEYLLCTRSRVFYINHSICINSFVLWMNHLHFNCFLWETSLRYTSVLDYEHVSRTDYACNPRFYCMFLSLPLNWFTILFLTLLCPMVSCFT
jgi:hypothetical protein